MSLNDTKVMLVHHTRPCCCCCYGGLLAFLDGANNTIGSTLYNIIWCALACNDASYVYDLPLTLILSVTNVHLHFYILFKQDLQWSSCQCINHSIQQPFQTRPSQYKYQQWFHRHPHHQHDLQSPLKSPTLYQDSQ